MQQLVVFAALISCAFATYHHAAPHIVPGPTVLTKNVHHVPAVAPVINYQRTVQAVHHPPVTSVHHAPDVVVQKAPRIHGYAYASEVRHDAPVAHAAPIVHAAPVVAHAAPVVAHAAPVVHAAPIAHGYAGHGYAGHGIAAPVVGHGYGKAPVVNPGPIVQVGHAPVEQPAVSSYSINTGRVHVATQAHYGVAHKLGVVNVPGVKTIAETVKHVPVAVSSHVVGHAPVAHGYGGHY